MKNQLIYATFSLCIVLALGCLVHGVEPNRLPDNIPPLTGNAIARPKEEGDWDSGWTIALTLPEGTWRIIQDVLPKMDWPEPTWEKVRAGTREGTLTLVGDTMPTQFKVVDLNGEQVGRDAVIKQLKTQQPVLVSASGQVPHACYRRLPTSAKLIVLLGPEKKNERIDSKVLSIKANEKQDVDLKDWTKEKSQRFFFNLMKKSAEFRIKSDEEASKYLRGIWRLEKRAHIGGGHYVRADRGEDITFIYTDKWLVLTARNGGDARDLAVARVESIKPDENGHLHVKTKNSITFDHFQPLDKDHMAILAYDFIAVVKRIVCETDQSPNGKGESSNQK